MPIMFLLCALLGLIFGGLAIGSLATGNLPAALGLGVLAVVFLGALIPSTPEQIQETINDLANGGFFDD